MARKLPRTISFDRMIQMVAERFGARVAASWTRAVLKYQKQISETALRSALASNNLAAVEAVVGASKLQAQVKKAVQAQLTTAAQVAGREAVKTLKTKGLEVAFNATHPNVILFAREQAAQLVGDVPKQVKQVIAEVVARGAEGRLTVAEQAVAIREVVGLPPQHANAPATFRQELREGQIAEATSRRLSAKTKQKIRARAKAGTIDSAFIKAVSKEYTASLIHLRALTIARTESLRASHNGLLESWQQARQQGVFPVATKKYWVVTRDARLSPEHARIPGMNRGGRAINVPFFTPDGPAMYPPSRPNCRCSVVLGFPR